MIIIWAFLAGISLLNVQKLECPRDNTSSGSIPVDSYHHSSNGITQTLLVLLIIMVAALLIGLLYVNRERIQNNVKPLVDNFNRSLQYQTIEKDNLEQQQVPPEVNV